MNFKPKLTDPKDMADALEDASSLMLRWGHNQLRHLTADEVAMIVAALRATRPEGGRWFQVGDGSPPLGEKVIVWDSEWKETCLMRYRGGATWSSRYTHWQPAPVDPDARQPQKERS